jgi:crotonobetainyl-CoA:carnitine CoA-transferase CaiB-like acyl-CoA transferase
LTRPFEGVKILDFTQVLAGPYASYQLALLGADVIKVERREGEDMRRTPLSREWAERGLAPGWQAINGNKRSLTLDLSKPEAIAIVKQLAAQADVVMENFRPGVMDKLGIGYAALSEINPRLIYCAISGFGQTGPERLGAGYDGKIQALSGIMSITGHAETGPTRAGFAVCDVRRAPRPPSPCRARCSSAPIPARVSWSTSPCWRRRWRSCPARSRTTRSPAIGSNSPAIRP